MGESGAQKKLNKNKLKKTIKNVLCRPDPVLWPEVSEDQKTLLEMALGKHKVGIPVIKKLHWNELKSIPKEKRPKPPKLEKVPGLLFGITECCAAIQSNQCSAIIIDAMVNPRVIVQPVTVACKKAQVPFICCKNLRKTSENYFGISTSCLGIKLNNLPDLTCTILEIAKNYSVLQEISNKNGKEEEIMDVDPSKEATAVRNLEQVTAMDESVCITNPYLYRSNRKTRVFIPNGTVVPAKTTKHFVGQNYIEFSDKPNKEQTDRSTFKKVMIKRISNNPNRVKSKRMS
ncbi:uncharacterized protein LOC128675353 [Plodia interpunctella]|uniref:uncharacterized protein LOC128675353 n=1 Tax=Plodia interpunctella TaxID=58824 RepID=UPI002368749A|nr:uncharacterized protein LOC128675353 [Plodia interpunctella]